MRSNPGKEDAAGRAVRFAVPPYSGCRARRRLSSTVKRLVIVAGAALACLVLDPGSQGGRGLHEVHAGAPILRLDGPNDGEPINGRLPLILRTSISEFGTIDISVNGIAMSSRSLHSGSRFDPLTGLHSSPVDIDLDAVRKIHPSLFNNPDAPPLEVTVVLHSSKGFVTFTSWQGYIGRPWLDFMLSSIDRTPVGRGGAAKQAASPVPDGMLGIVVHPLPRDSYYFLVASTSTEILKLSPENPRLLREGKVLAGETWFAPRAGEPAPRKVVVVDPRVVRETHVVLWTHSFSVGWRRSAVFAIPR
jgi:hypothetical protein